MKIQIPTKKEWREYFSFRRKISVNLIVSKVIAEIDYKDCIKKTKKALKKDAETIKLADLAYEKQLKSLKKDI